MVTPPMEILRTYADLPASARGAVVALGNFDGVHRGHQAVIGEARALAHAMGASLGVMVFEPHPRAFFAPDAPAFRLMTLETKARTLAGLGVDLLFALPFNRELAAMSAQDFVLDVLVGGLGAVHVVAGPDFRFGKGRAGDMSLLGYMGDAEGFGVTPVAAVGDGIAGGLDQISSTAIRTALTEGRPKDAAHLLGRPWCVDGPVIQGDQRGRTIGFPTANVPLGDLLEPRFGVYAVQVTVLAGPQTGTYGGVANLGRRPTFDKTDVRLEAHLFDFEADLYGAPVSVALLDFIRPEQKFEGIEALLAQIQRDAQTARALLAARSGHAC